MAGAGCSADASASTILLEGACDRQDIVLDVVQAMTDDEALYGDERQNLIRLVHRRITEDATISPELDRSKYGEPLSTYRDKILRSIQNENALTSASSTGPAWHDLLEEGQALADQWGCD